MAQGFAGSGLSIVSGALGVSTGGNTLGNTGTTFGTVVFAGIGQVTLSQSTAAGSLATITISAPVQSTQPGVTAFGVSTLGNTAGNTGTTQGTVVLAGGNRITLSQSTAAGSLATITVSGENAIFGAGVSTGGNTSGTTGTVTGTLVLAGGNNVTLSQSTNTAGATITISAASAAAGTVVSGIGVSTGGNTAGNTGTTVGTVVFAGAGIVTLSQATAAGSSATISISASQSVQPAINLAAGTQTATSGTVVLSNSNGISFGMSNSSVVTASADYVRSVSAGTTNATGNLIVLSDSNNVTFGANGATITASVTVASTQASIRISAGTTSILSSAFTFSDSNNISFGINNGTITATVSQSVQPGVTAIGVSTGGNTSGNTGTTQGTYILAGGNNITLSQATAAGSLATVTISGPNMFQAGVSTGGNTAGSTGTVSQQVVLVGGSNITLSQSTGGASSATVTIVGRDAIFGAGVSTGGNTSGTTGTVTGTLVLAGGNNITLSQSTNANGATVTISGATAAAATVVSAIGVSTGGNTSGDTGTTVGTVVFAGINHITLSQSTAAGSLATITISGDNAVFGAGISTGGNTSGTSGTNSGTFVLVGGNNITLSQATGVGGNTVTISAPNAQTFIGGIAAGTQTATSGTVVFSNSNNVTFGMSNSSVVTASVADTLRLFSHNADWISNFTIQNATFSLIKFSTPINITGSRMQVVMDLTGNSNSTGAITISAGVYTMSGSTASLSTSASRQISWTSGSATTVSTVYGGVSGTRYRTLAFDMTLTPGDYLMGLWARTTNNGTWRIFGRQGMSLVGALDANETNVYLDGVSTSSFTTAMPTSINVTDTNYNRTGASALRSPGFIIAGTL